MWLTLKPTIRRPEPRALLPAHPHPHTEDQAEPERHLKLSGVRLDPKCVIASPLPGARTRLIPIWFVVPVRLDLSET